MSFRQSFNKWGAIVFGALITFGVVKTAIQHFGEAAPSASADPSASPNGTVGGFVLATCPEPIRVYDCRVEPQTTTPTCTIENASQATFSNHLKVWSYSTDGVLLGDTPLLVFGMMPNQKKRLQLHRAADTAKKLVVCSMDPEDPLVKDRIAFVGANAAAATAQALAPLAPATTAPTSNGNVQDQANNQGTAATDNVRTVAGDLVSVAKANGGNSSILKLAGRVVFDGADSAVKMEKTFATDGKTLVLLSISDGGNGCPALYRILSIAANGGTFTSDEFGTCSDLAKVTAVQSSLMISMPNMDGKDESSWMFSGETLNQVRGGSRKK